MFDVRPRSYLDLPQAEAERLASDDRIHSETGSERADGRKGGRVDAFQTPLQPTGSPEALIVAASRSTGDAQRSVGAYLRLLAGLSTGREGITGTSRRSAMGNPMAPSLEAAFVVHAAGWVAENQIDGRVLADFGVPREVLAKAGVHVPSAAEAVRSAYAGGPFTVPSIAHQAEVSPMTARRVIQEDLAAGKLEEIGFTSSVGRPARRYQTAKPMP